MTLDIVCPSCGRLLRIATEHAGKQIRCPACQQVSISPASQPIADTAPAEGHATTESADTAKETTLWHVRTPEGAVYGPIRWDVVLAWAEEGRVADDCELATSPDGPWQPAGSHIPGLGSSVLSPGGEVTTPAGSGGESLSPPFSGNWSPQVTPVPGTVAAHRAALVLIMGILGFVVGCPVFSVIAWVLGSRDLREMRAGRMDRSGESATLVGMILGIVLSVLWLVVTFIVLTIFLVAIAAQF